MRQREVEPVRRGGDSRRGFLKTVGSLAAATAPSRAVRGADLPQPLPQVRIGKHSISRLICGTNPFIGISHTSTFIDGEMTEYYSPLQVLKTLGCCEAAGINAVQGLNPELYRRFTAGGGKIRLFANGQGDAARLEKTVATGCIGIHHYGVATDNLYRSGRLATVKEYVKRVRDTGLLVGLATHIPTIVDIVESEGWDLDYYMTCVYQWGRTTEDFEKLFGDKKDLLPVETYSMVVGDGYAEVFLSGDPPKMYKMIRQTKKPCLAYKILAAGRKCQMPGSVEQAFQEAFENIKPADAIIVGMYDRYVDQIAENCGFVRRFGATGA